VSDCVELGWVALGCVVLRFAVLRCVVLRFAVLCFVGLCNNACYFISYPSQCSGWKHLRGGGNFLHAFSPPLVSFCCIESVQHVT